MNIQLTNEEAALADVTRIEIRLSTNEIARKGHVYLVLGDWPYNGEWAIWDERPVRRGARLISANHSLANALKEGRALANKPCSY